MSHLDILSKGWSANAKGAFFNRIRIQRIQKRSPHTRDGVLENVGTAAELPNHLRDRVIVIVADPFD